MVESCGSPGSGERALGVPARVHSDCFVPVVPGWPEVVGRAVWMAEGLWDLGADFLVHAIADQGYFFLLDAGRWMLHGILLPWMFVGGEAQSFVGEGESAQVAGDLSVAMGGVTRLFLESVAGRSA